MELKIMSYNVQSGKSGEPSKAMDYKAACSVIKEINPDIAGLQEVGHEPPHGYKFQPEFLRTELGMNAYFAPAKPDWKYGNLMLTRFGINGAANILVPDPKVKDEPTYYETRCLLVAELDCGITFINTHLGLAKSEAKSAVQTLIKVLEHIKTPVILTGDFNLAPNHEILKPIYEKLKDTADYNKSDFLTFPAGKAEIKLDHIFVSNEFKVKAFKVHKTLASDHYPVSVELVL